MVMFSWKLPSCGIQANPNRIRPDSTWSEGIYKFGRCFQATSVAFQHYVQSIRICACTGLSDFCWEWNDFPWLITMFPICFPYVSYMVPICFPYVSHMFPTKHSHFLTWDCHDRPALRAKKVLVTWGRLEHHHLESIHLVIGSLKNRSLLGVHIYSMHI